MISIEPFYLLLAHHLHHDRSGVDRTEGKRLHLKELAKLGFLVRSENHSVLDAHTETTFEIDARLVGDGHSSTEWGRLPLHTYLMRTLMHIKVRTYTMTCAVEIVHALTPHIHTSKSIKLCAAYSVREFHHGKLDITLQYESIYLALLLCDRTQSDGTGDVCRSILILCTAVDEH